MASFCWERHPDGPFATLIAVAATYLDPENYHLDALKELAKREDDEEMRVFKRELREARLDPSGLPGDELSEAVEYDNGSGEAFLRRLWHDLYGDEPLQAPRGLLDPDLEFQALDTAEFAAMVPRAGESVLRRGRAPMELGRRASGDTTLLQKVADIIRDPGNRRLVTVGTASVSQLGAAGLVAGPANRGGAGPGADRRMDCRGAVRLRVADAKLSDPMAARGLAGYLALASSRPAPHAADLRVDDLVLTGPQTRRRRCPCRVRVARGH